jgi:hypothetical protein
MKKWILLLVTIIGFGSFASAQQITPPQLTLQQLSLQQLTIKAGAAISFGADIAIRANLGVRTPNLFKLSPTFGLGARADFSAEFLSGIIGYASVSPVLNISLDKNTVVYLGPTVGLALGGVNPLVLIGADLGFTYAISPYFGVYGDSKWFLFPVFAGAFDLGATYNLSQELSIYLEFQGNFNPTDFKPGVALGLFIRL